LRQATTEALLTYAGFALLSTLRDYPRVCGMGGRWCGRTRQMAGWSWVEGVTPSGLGVVVIVMVGVADRRWCTVT